MKATEKAYLAGFLDGDGSIHVRLKPNSTYKFGFQVAPSVVFYQADKEIEEIRSIRDLLGIGYIRRRKDGIAEYIIGDSESILYFLSIVTPYLRLKRKQAEILKEIIALKKKVKSASDFLCMCEKIDEFAELNYSKKRIQNSEKVKEHLYNRGLLTP